jgi:beta-phosphoglucomutase-like phosphatase (HAD superfamily)
VQGRGGFRGPVGFDLDMTLIDSRPAIMAAFGGLAVEAGVDIDVAAVDARLGF